MKCAYSGLFIIVCFATASFANAKADSCPPAGHDKQTLQKLAAQEFQIPDNKERQALAKKLIACLSNQDPAIRDDFAFSAYSTWLRNKQLDQDTRAYLLETLEQDISITATDKQGFRKPFSTLTLAEIARTDRKDPWMSPAQRDNLVRIGTEYLRSVSDYRGFDEKQGWRHGVAHAADLLLQLSLNPAITKTQDDMILSAIADQVHPDSSHYYTFGEPDRLVAPVYYIAAKKNHTAEEWQAWLQTIATLPGGLKKEDVYKSHHGLSWRHNVQSFLNDLYVNLSESQDVELRDTILPLLRETLRNLP